MSKQKVLITGGAGYIGSHVALELKSIDADITILDNLSTGFEANIQHGTLTTIDLSNFTAVDACIADIKPDAVIHFAGSIVVPESVQNPIKYYSNNTANSLNLIQCCVKHKVKHFLFSSTAAVYGVPESGTCAETSPTAPINPYGQSKRMTEHMLEDICNATDMNFVALRYFNVAGAHESNKLGQRMPDATHLIKIIAQVLTKKRASINVFGTDYPTPDGTCIRDYIHVCDLAIAHRLALQYLQDGGTSNIFNCGYSKGFSVNEVIDTAKTLFGAFNVIPAPRRDGDPPCLIANADKLKTTLNWTPQHKDLAKIIQSAVDFERLL
jgi:UDP-glucose 4-epimerase